MNILVIEDEPLIRKGLVKLLTKIDLKNFLIDELTDVESAEEADKLLENNTYDIIFTDIEMGDVNGLDLIEKWQATSKTTQWVIVSGYDKFEFAQQAIRYGVREYMLKPVTKEKMIQTISECMKNMEQKNNDFVEASDIEWLLSSLEETIWSIDSNNLERDLSKWKDIVEGKSFHTKYYCNLLSYILEVLFRRISTKGSKMFQSFHWEVDEAGIDKADTRFKEKCLEIIEMIEEQRKGNVVDPIDVAKQYIIHNLNKDVSLEEVAERLGLNASYFSQLFKKETGETFIKFRIRLRMEEAKNLLLRKDIRVIDIPSLIGLNDHPHFTKTFKKYTGLTPSEYRVKMGID